MRRENDGEVESACVLSGTCSEASSAGRCCRHAWKGPWRAWEEGEGLTGSTPPQSHCSTLQRCSHTNDVDCRLGSPVRSDSLLGLPPSYPPHLAERANTPMAGLASWQECPSTARPTPLARPSRSRPQSRRPSRAVPEAPPGLHAGTPSRASVRQVPRIRRQSGRLLGEQRERASGEACWSLRPRPRQSTAQQS